jgi:hypothetical protein
MQIHNIKLNSPIGNLSAARAGAGKSAGEIDQELRQEAERLKRDIEERRAAEANSPPDPGFLAEAPASHSQKGFCAALKNIIAEARHHFQAIIAEEDILKALARISIPGSGTCEIEDRSIFTCTSWFKRREIAEKQMAGLARKIGQCLQGVRAQRSTDPDGSAEIGFDRKQPEIKILRKKHDDYDGYSVELSVTYY